ncbi:PspC domain-containing protein [Brevibacillus laterosporus]|uniref:PspC domain-containing protein n=1 Tax=Brevibacillus laterosporus TaxID=1465 RepID=UPI0014441CBA|nr:PspC domain-containing protein [Brevibacillus laterosporus]NKQ21913.1 PspC domain-containing protein [Brevibacillus laterosporus]WNX30479.1 PspC domain-containing protein [Brevibacillus laterosporus]
MNRIYRSQSDKKIFGVCGGFAAYLGIDATLLRLVTAVVTFFTGVPLLLYFLLAFIMPKEPMWEQARYQRPQPEFASGFYQEPLYEKTNYDKGLDQEMERLEKAAMRQEIKRLRAELEKYQS